MQAGAGRLTAVAADGPDSAVVSSPVVGDGLPEQMTRVAAVVAMAEM